MTPQQLKASLLQDAIRGKLTDQRPEDGSAEDLYRAILAEKKRLIKAGKLKKEKPLPPIEEKDIPFDIPENWKWVRLGELCSIVTGKKDANFGKNGGEYTFFTCARTPISCPSYSFEGKAILLAGNGDLSNISMFEGKFEAYQRTYVLQNFLALDIRYLYYHLVSNWVQYNKDKTFGGVITFVRLANLTDYPVALPPLAEQERIVAKLEELLPLVERYGKAYTQLTALEQRFPASVRKSLLQEAIQGKLTDQRPEDGSAEDLYRAILAEKKRLIKAGKLKKEKPLPPIEEKDIPFDIPENWKWVRIPEVFYCVGNKDNQILSKDVKKEGKYPVVSQGANLIDGYSNEEEKVIRHLPLVMFGDHTRNVKMIDFPFIIGADGTKFMSPILINVAFFYHSVCYIADHLKNRGYARHFILFRKELLPLPPLAEQERIVAKLEELLPLCD